MKESGLLWTKLESEARILRFEQSILFKKIPA